MKIPGRNKTIQIVRLKILGRDEMIPDEIIRERDGRYNRFVTGKVLNRYRSGGLPVTSHDVDILGDKYSI